MEHEQTQPGDQLKEMRTRLQLSVRDVSRLSEEIAEGEGNREFFLTFSWLTQLENKPSTVPSMFKLFTLAAIYGCGLHRLLLLYGIRLDQIASYHKKLSSGRTHPVNFGELEAPSSFEIPVRFDPGFGLEKTNLLSRMIAMWGELPVEYLRDLDLKNGVYGFVGLDDLFMSPYLEPGTFVQIDPGSTKPRQGPFRNEFERPIYFFELETEYACSWCDIRDGKLILVGHSLSPCTTQMRVLRFPADVRIIGEVVAIAKRIRVSSSEAGAASLAGQSQS